MPTASHALERRLLVAILGATACVVPSIACRKERWSPPSSSDAAPARSKLCTTSFEKEEEMCREPFAKVARAEGTGEPAPPPPASAYDTNGCLPKNEVSTSCCNPGVDGPRF